MSAFVFDLIDAQALKTPQNVAVGYGNNRTLSYAELIETSNRLANMLLSSVPDLNRPVIVMTGKGPEMVIAMLAIFKAGGIYVPLDPAYPDQRVLNLIERVDPALLLVHETLAARVEQLLQNHPAPPPQVICSEQNFRLANTGQTLADYSPNPPVVEIEPRAPAYIFFTSGSEGQPKGVLGCHRSLTHFVQWEALAFEVCTTDRFSQVGAISSDASLKDILVPLSAGASVWIPDGGDLLEWLGKCHISVLGCVPTVFRNLLESAETQSEEAREAVKNLRMVLLAGEVLKVGWVQRWFDLFGSAITIANLYGATEATVYSVYHLITERPSEGTRVLPVGKAIAGYEILVVNRGNRACSVGEIGDIYLRSEFLTLGYYNDPETTARAFVPDPLRPENPHPVYRTGDRGRFLPGGVLEFVGRKDGQVKIRGYRVEPGEIEMVLAHHPALREVAVTVREDHADELRLVAYMISHASPPPGANDIYYFLKARLPEYMLPADFVWLDSFPLTHNGKIDRNALPPPDAHNRASSAATYSAPRTPPEELMCGLWAQVLGLPVVGRHDNFFELGGHSLTATRLISRIRQTFKQEVPLRRLFESPTPAGLLEEMAESGGSASPEWIPAPRGTEMPTSFAQHRLWFLNRLEPEAPFYNIHAAVELTGQLDKSVLERSLNAIVQRHETLRTSFGEGEGQPFQIIEPELTLTLPVIDLQGYPPPAQQEKLAELATAEARKPFNLAIPPLLRLTLLQLSQTRHVLLLTMHHIISDRWSCAVFTRELGILYRAFAAGQPDPLPPISFQYADFAYRQREWLQGERESSLLSYWQTQLAGVPPLLRLSIMQPTPTMQTYQGAHATKILDRELVAQLKTFSNEEGVTLFMTLLTAFQVVLYHFSGQTDLVVGTDVANRNRSETEGLIGFFINQLVLRTNQSGNPTFREMLGRVRETTLGAYTQQDLPFEKLVEALNPRRSVQYNPIFQVKLVLQNGPEPELALPGLQLRLIPVEKGTTQVDLNLRITEVPKGLELSAEYSRDLFEASAIARFLDHFELSLRTGIAQPETHLAELVKQLIEAEEAQSLQNRKRMESATVGLLKQARRKAVSLEAGEAAKYDK